MKVIRSLKKVSLIAFLIITLATAAIIFVISNLDLSHSYHPLSLTAPVPPLVYPKSVSNASNLQVRKNVVQLTSAEKAAFVRALKALKNKVPEGSTLSVYDQFVLQHVLTMGFRQQLRAKGPAQSNPAHGQPAFLPWHRQFTEL